eukprot:INCI8555.1.p1 GENE.INCI8555.1~~INCI8555.1.p1  ORF type:complete len:255 (+),score=68.85 INCI8555.1:171-935(+)
MAHSQAAEDVTVPRDNGHDSDSSEDFEEEESTEAPDVGDAASAWIRYFETKKPADVPDFRRFSSDVNVNIAWIRKLKGVNKGGMLHSALKQVQSYFVHKSDFKVSRRSRLSALDDLERFAKNATSIIAEQDRLRESEPPKKRRAAGALRQKPMSEMERGQLFRDKTQAQIFLNTAAAEKAKAEANKAKIEARMLELTTTATVMKTLGVEIGPAMEASLKQRLAALLGSIDVVGASGRGGDEGNTDHADDLTATM